MWSVRAAQFLLCKAQYVSTETASKVVAIVLVVENGLKQATGVCHYQRISNMGSSQKGFHIGSRKSDICGSYGFELLAQKQANASVGQWASRFLYW